MAIPIRMPALGQTSDELRLLAWLKQEGENVEEGDPLIDIETDKTTLEVEAVASGTLLKQLCQPGETVLAGTIVAWIGEAGEAIPAEIAPAKTVVPTETEAGDAVSSLDSPGVEKILATPAARALARERRIDLASIRGSGLGGRIERRDVEGLEPRDVERAALPSDSGFAGLDEDVPKHRQAIARRLTRAAAVPQFTLVKTIDARPALRRVSHANATITHVLLQAIAAALRQFPFVNRVWVDDGPKFRQFVLANVGLAIAAEDNLIVATIPEPDRVELVELARIVRRAVDEGRAGKLSTAFSKPAAVTLSNLGMFDIDRFDAIVDPDQTAILAIGRATERPVITGEGIVAVPQIDLSLTVDHRTVDGAQAARFLEAICAELSS